MLDPNYSDLLSAFLAHDVRFLVVGAYALGAHGKEGTLQMALCPLTKRTPIRTH